MSSNGPSRGSFNEGFILIFEFVFFPFKNGSFEKINDSFKSAFTDGIKTKELLLLLLLLFEFWLFELFVLLLLLLVINF